MLTREETTAILLEERLLLTSYIGVIVRNYHLSEDLFQDVCVQALVREEPFESRDHLLNWARLLGRHRAINVLKSREAKCVCFDEETLEVLADDWPHCQTWNMGSLTALSQCLKRLTENNREIVRLRYFEGRSGSELANHLGRKLATVYQAIARIHKTLGECIRTRLTSVEGGSHE